MQLILDIGSGNSLPDADTAIKLIDEIIKRDTGKHEVIFKTQLFESAPPNKPLEWKTFNEAYHYAKGKGYHLTSSVFDHDSLDLLVKMYDSPNWRLPFIKIACRPDLYWLIGEIPRRIPVYYSVNDDTLVHAAPENGVMMLCVPKYPALYVEYHSAKAISDHTVGWQLLKDYQPEILEKHICLEHNDTNPDAGAFAVTPEELSEIL